MIIIKKKIEQRNKYLLHKSTIEDPSEISNDSIYNLETWNKFSSIILKLKRFGVVLDSNESLGPIINYLKYLQIIQFNFLTFKDGRPFTLAKNLRRKFNFKNEIRASGHILPDQYSFLIRCGFDSVEIKQTDKLTWLKVLGMEAEEYYQPF